jgi:hypothetical protein
VRDDQREQDVVHALEPLSRGAPQGWAGILREFAAVVARPS